MEKLLSDGRGTNRWIKPITNGINVGPMSYYSCVLCGPSENGSKNDFEIRFFKNYNIGMF